MALTTKKAATAKKLARPPIKPPNLDPDPLGFARVLAETSAQLEEAYHAQLRAFLRKNLLVGGLASPAVEVCPSRMRAAPF